MTRHRPAIRREIAETPEGEAYVHRLRCGCSPEPLAEDRYAFELREVLEAHLAEVTPPEAERCRDPKRHRTKPHDRCALCADQMALPGL